jgi:HD domain
VRSTLFGMLLAIGLSLGASHLGRTSWEKRADTGDLLYDELMVWGFIRRWRNERRLASALKLLGSMHDAQRNLWGALSAESQAKALEQLSSALEARDPNTHGHSRRVARHAWMIAKRMGLSDEEVARVRTAAAVHDVGKLQTPPSVLRKPGSLTDEEFDVIKRHPVDGAKLVAALGDAQLTAMVRHHHERLDGTGYPSRLSGEEIPLGARIIAVADTFDAITCARAYRPARPHAAALEILKREAGTQLDPAVVRAFCGFYAGRRPLLAGWATLASLPGQALASLGGVATATKALAVAAVVGSAAAGTATIARPATNRQPAHKLESLRVTSAQHSRAASRTAARSSLGVQASPGRHVNPPVGSSRRVASAKTVSAGANGGAVMAVVSPATGAGSSSVSTPQQPSSTGQGQGTPPAEETQRTEPPPHTEAPQSEPPPQKEAPQKEAPHKEPPSKEPPPIEPPHAELPHIELPHVGPVHK